jgi:hypothetical protein
MGHLILLRATRTLAVSDATHLSPTEAAAFVDATLPSHERARIERHLAVCDACREEVAACARLIGTAPVQRTRLGRWRVLAPIAAVLLAVVVLGRPSVRERPAATLERGTGAANGIVLIQPEAGRVVRHDELRFVWRPIEASAGYRMIIKDSTGATVWTQDASDTTYVAPDSVPLKPGTSYVWRVDGQRADGTTASSPEIGFRVAR